MREKIFHKVHVSVRLEEKVSDNGKNPWNVAGVLRVLPVKNIDIVFAADIYYTRSSKKQRRNLEMAKDKGFIAEFKKFIMRGNVLDMAVGVILGGAFTAIVTSLNVDILTPLLGIFGGTDFSYLSVTLGSGENAPVLNYGNFITAVLNFLITALVIFCLIKGINKVTEKLVKKEETPAVPTTKKCPYCMSEVDIKATRCPHCTSHLETENAQ